MDSLTCDRFSGLVAALCKTETKTNQKAFFPLYTCHRSAQPYTACEFFPLAHKVMRIKNVRNAFILDANTTLHSRHATRFSYAGSIVTQPYRTAAPTSLFPLSFKPSEAQKNIEPCPRHTASVNKPARPCEQPSPKWGKA